MVYWEVIITSFFLSKKSIQYGNIIYVISLAVSNNFLVLLSSSNGIQYCPTTTTLGMCLLCGPKATYSSSPEDNNSLVVGVKYAVVGLLGCAAKLHPSEDNHGAFILPSWGYKGDLHQLGNAQLGSSATL
jgi:hypothetical protein